MKLCMGCMENIEDHVTVCPYCGYDETTLRQEAYYLDPGTVIGGKYIVGRVLEYRGYTISYLGMDAENNRKIRIKEYLPSDFSTRSEGETEVTIYSGDAVEQFEQGLTAFLNESNRIQHLNNVPGIAEIYDCIAENDTGYVISEYVEGQTLKEMLDAGKIFSPIEAKDFISQLLIGLSQVHPLDIIHCDIAPETIMITNTGEVKLLDFGATRYVTTANSKSLAVILKQGYAPEEQYRSRGVRGPWTDVYALGAVMYRMITGKVPVESVDRALLDELEEPSKLGIGIPQNIENALMNALNVYQKDRTPSAGFFLRELNSSQVVRKQIKKKKNDTGKFSKWAKGLVAGLLLIAGIGGILIYNTIAKQNTAVDDKGLVAENITEQNPEDAKAKLEEQGFVLKEEKVKYDRSAETERIIDQNPTYGAKLENNVINYTVLTKLKCNYKDVRDNRKSAFSLAEYLGLSQNSVCKEATKNIGGKDAPDDASQIYGAVYGIRVKGEFISLEEMKSRSEDIITISDIETIYYYISPFLFQTMENYIGKNIKDIQFDKCVENKKEEVTPTGKKEEPPADAIYYSFDSKKKEGDIVKQNYKTGETYDARKKEKKIPFETVKEQIGWYGKKPDALKEDLEKKGFTVKLEGAKAKGNRISNVNAINEKGEKEKVFVKTKRTVIEIETENVTPTPRATSTPRPTPRPTSVPTQRPTPSQTDNMDDWLNK